MNHVVSINAIIIDTMQFLYLIHREDVCYTLLHVPCLKLYVLYFSVCFYAPSFAVHLHSLFFGLDVTVILVSFEGCDGGAVIEVSPIARELLSL